MCKENFSGLSAERGKMNELDRKMKEINKATRSERKARIKWLLAELKMMKMCIQYFHHFEKPKNEEQKEEFRNNMRLYDESVNRIESEFLSKIRAELIDQIVLCDDCYVKECVTFNEKRIWYQKRFVEITNKFSEHPIKNKYEEGAMITLRYVLINIFGLTENEIGQVLKNKGYTDKDVSNQLNFYK